MLVRVRPVGSNRTTTFADEEARPTVDEPVSEVTGRAVGRDDRRIAGSTILATRDNPLPAATSRSGNGETRVAVRRRPGDAPEEPRPAAPQAGVRLVARRPNAIQDTDRSNYVTVRRRPTTPEVTTPAPTTTTTTTLPPPLETEPVYSNNNSSDEYEDEYEYYDYDEDETTTAAPTKRTTTTTTTTTTKRPRPALNNRRRYTTPSPQSAPASSEKPPTSSSSSSRGSGNSNSRRGPVASQQPTSSAAPPASIAATFDGPPVEVRSDSDVECFRRGVFIHPNECSKFVVCAPASRSTGQLKGRVLNCPANQIYLVDIGRCMKGDRTKCQKL